MAKLTKAPKNVVTVTVSGPTGSGKSALCGEIEIALRAIGVSVEWNDEAERQMNNVETDERETLLERYRPHVVIVERNEPHLGRQALSEGNSK